MAAIDTPWLVAGIAIAIPLYQLAQDPRPVLGAPFSVIWAGLVAEALLGNAAVRDLRSLRDLTSWRVVPAVVIGLVAIAVVLAVTRPFHVPREATVGVGLAFIAGAWLGRQRLPMSALLLPIEVVSFWLVTDLNSTDWLAYDLRVYLAAGAHALAGTAVYLDHVLELMPSSAGSDYFLYPPVWIPLLEWASQIPVASVRDVFGAAMWIAGFLAFRALGLTWTWSIVLLAFPPLVGGISSGNVANLVFLLFAAGFRNRWLLPLGVLLKLQAALPVLWAVRERSWRALLAGSLLVAGIIAVTLPSVGVPRWQEWVSGLAYREQSQHLVPTLFGDSLARWLPSAAYAAVALAAVGLALLPRGRQGLAAVGLSTTVASPSLWLHGFTMALPAALAIPSSPLLWLALGLPPSTLGLWAMALLATLGLVGRRWDEETLPSRPMHPFGGTFGPWAQRPRNQSPQGVAI